jgi:hypothetical protein
MTPRRIKMACVKPHLNTETLILDSCGSKPGYAECDARVSATAPPVILVLEANR